MYLIFLIRVNCGAALNHSQKQARNPSTVWRCCQAAFLASTACSANSMHIILTVWVGRWLLFAMLGIWIFFECFAELDGVLSVARCVIVHHQCHTCTCIRCAHWFSDSLSLQHILKIETCNYQTARHKWSQSYYKNVEALTSHETQ